MTWSGNSAFPAPVCTRPSILPTPERDPKQGKSSKEWKITGLPPGPQPRSRKHCYFPEAPRPCDNCSARPGGTLLLKTELWSHAAWVQFLLPHSQLCNDGQLTQLLCASVPAFIKRGRGRQTIKGCFPLCGPDVLY